MLLVGIKQSDIRAHKNNKYEPGKLNYLNFKKLSLAKILDKK